MQQIVITPENFDKGLQKLLRTDPISVKFIKCDLEGGLPGEIFFCFNLKHLIIDSCNYYDVEQRISTLKLESIELINNNIINFPEILLKIKTLKNIILDDNNITTMDNTLNYRDINIYLGGQYIRKIPTTGVFMNVMALTADINHIIYSGKDNYILGPNDEWLDINASRLNDCCLAATNYTYKGDRILNGCLRQNFLLDELRPFCESLLNAKVKSLSIPFETLLFRGIEKKHIDRLRTGETIIDLGFSSFTFSQHIARSFSTHIIILPIKDNIKGVSFSFKHNQSRYNEREILLGPNLNIRIMDIKQFDKFTYYICDYMYDDNSVDLKINNNTITSIIANRYSDILEELNTMEEVLVVHNVILFNNNYVKESLVKGENEFKKNGIAALGDNDNNLYYLLLLNLIVSFNEPTYFYVNCNFQELKSHDTLPQIFIDDGKQYGNLVNIKTDDISDFMRNKSLVSWTDKFGNIHDVSYHNFYNYDADTSLLNPIDKYYDSEPFEINYNADDYTNSDEYNDFMD